MKKITLVLGSFLILTIFSGSVVVHAQSVTGQVASSYSTEARPVGFFDKVKLFFTFDQEKKAELFQDFSNRNFELAKEKLQSGDTDGAKDFFSKSDEDIKKASDSISKIADEKKQEERLNSISTTASQRTVVLTAVREKVENPVAKAAIQNALDKQVEVKNSADEKIQSLLNKIAELEKKIKELEGKNSITEKKPEKAEQKIEESTDSNSDWYKDNAWRYNPKPVDSNAFTIISPNGGETYQIGEKVIIKWKGGPEKSTISFSLGKDHWSDTDALILADNDRTVNDGEYVWTISERIEPGTYYLNGGNNHEGFWDHSDKKFTIIDMHDPDPSGSIPFKILSPNGGEVYTRGQQVTIKWEGGPANSGIGLALIKQTPFQVDSNIVENTPGTANDGSYVWTIPSTIAPGTYYINGGNNNNGFWDYSDQVFKIN
jgi:peptidoglycan hydrolase CwlO-like protein